MNELQVFKYENETVRTVQKDGEAWWVLKDVCDVLGIGNTTDVANRLETDEKATFDSIECLRKDTVFISESGLYNVILRSDKPEAKAFKRWVTHEVLPSIRKTGSYIATPKTYIEALEALVASEKEKLLLEAKNETLEIALNESLKFYTVAKYNRAYGMGWDMQEAQRIGKRLAAYCRSRAIEIRPCETNDERFGAVNSYPLTAWEDFLRREGEAA